ncbi:MAG: TPM domain-containing protein [Planctomycetaceae bacterium]|nr:TPM domain-containing protein [Planctomycetaceae bacterium]
MLKPRWILTLPLILVASIGSARAASIRDNAGLFDPDVVREAQAQLERVERNTGITTTIETIDSLQGEPITEATRRRAVRSGTEGFYILIPKAEHKIDVLVPRPFRGVLSEQAIRDAFVAEFKRRDFNAGLKQGVRTIEDEAARAKEANGGVFPARGAPPMRARPVPHHQSFGLGSLLGIGLVILVVLIGLRALGRLFGGGYRGGYAGGPRMMGGQGYGAPGYGGRGGGFLSSLFGGIGGAMAGNWLYDQFSGRHHGGGYADNTSQGADVGDQGMGAGGSDWSGGGAVGDWGGDAGSGGDWGGGDGGGGDWGGGGDGGGDW